MCDTIVAVKVSHLSSQHRSFCSRSSPFDCSFPSVIAAAPKWFPQDFSSPQSSSVFAQLTAAGRFGFAGSSPPTNTDVPSIPQVQF